MKKKVAIFGGSFDPIHFGHIGLAIEIFEKKIVDEIIFVPTYVSPFKKKTPSIISCKHRKKMVELAIQDIEGFRVSEVEMKRKDVSYTVETLAFFAQQYPHQDLFLLIAQDVAWGFEKWKDVASIMKSAEALVGYWEEDFSFPHAMPQQMQKWLRKNAFRIPYREISSTDVRKRLKKGLYCGHLLPKNVLDYIHRHELYYSFDNK